MIVQRVSKEFPMFVPMIVHGSRHVAERGQVGLCVFTAMEKASVLRMRFSDQGSPREIIVGQRAVTRDYSSGTQVRD